MICVPKTEYDSRVQRLQKKMEEENLDAVLCYANTGAYDNVFYLSQYWPLFEVGGVLVGRKGDPLVLMGGRRRNSPEQAPMG